MSNLIPITRIYDIYPKYTYSNDVKKFMDEIVDIDRANVFTEADMVDILDKIRAEMADLEIIDYDYEGYYQEGYCKAITDVSQIIDKYRKEETNGNS